MTPALKPVLSFNIRADEPQLVYSNKTATMQYVGITGGSVQSLDPSRPFDAEITHGKDDITLFAHDPSTGHLDCNMYLKFANGKTGLVKYSGVVQFGEHVVAVTSGKSSEMSFEDGYVTNHPIFYLDEESKDEQWVKDINFIGKGRFVRDKEGTLFVQYYVYTFA